MGDFKAGSPWRLSTGSLRPSSSRSDLHGRVLARPWPRICIVGRNADFRKGLVYPGIVGRHHMQAFRPLQLPRASNFVSPTRSRNHELSFFLCLGLFDLDSYTLIEIRISPTGIRGRDGCRVESAASMPLTQRQATQRRPHLTGCTLSVL